MAPRSPRGSGRVLDSTGPAAASWAGPVAAAGQKGELVPTTFGIVAMGLMVVGAIAGLVIGGLQITRRASSKRARGSLPGAPFDENTAAAQNNRSADRNDLA